MKEQLLSAIFPKGGSCAGCGRILFHEDILCDKCSNDLPEAEFFCERCGRLIREKGVCAGCVDGISKWDMAYCLYEYSFPADEMIINMKYHSKPYLSEYLGRKLGEMLKKKVKEKEFDVITFIPSAAERLSERGYNQAELLAEEVGKVMNIPVRTLIGTEDTPHQVGLAAAERYKNARDRFSFVESGDISKMKIILIDDVMTTGATMAAASEVLRENGCEYILAATVAQTLSEVVKEGDV